MTTIAGTSAETIDLFSPEVITALVITALTVENDPGVSADQAPRLGGHSFLDEFAHRIGYPHATALAARRIPA